MWVAWPHIREQYQTASQAREQLGPLSWEERAAALDQPGYRAAGEIARAVPAGECVLVVAYTGPEHLKYYRARFQYYLYPRRVRFSDRTDAPGGGCGFLAVFRDTPANLKQEAFHGRWDEPELAARTQVMTRVSGGERVEIFRAR
jgi:hypothetical protein